MKNGCTYDHSSSILTLQSVPEFHRFSQMCLSAIQVADYTADREFHPALKNSFLIGCKNINIFIKKK
jgi:hypothetical protein